MVNSCHREMGGGKRSDSLDLHALGTALYLFTVYVTKYIFYSYVQSDTYLQLCKASTLILCTHV